jgi:hypothetical protein
MVQKGIVSLLIPMGADPDHHNVWKFKNPLSPKWSVSACDDSFPTMDEWRSFLPTITPDQREMKRRAKVVKVARLGVDPDDVTLSSAIWNDGVTSRRLMIRAAQARKDPAFLKTVVTSHAAFVDWLYHPVDSVVTRRLIKIHKDTPAVRSVLQAQREFVVQLKLTPKQASQFADRGRDQLFNLMETGDVGPNASADDRKSQELTRKSEGGTRSRQFAKDLNCGLIAEEIERRITAGIPVAKAEVVKALVTAETASRSVAYARFDVVYEVVLQAARYQAVRLEALSSSSSLPVDNTSSSDPVVVSGGQFDAVAACVPTETSDQTLNPESSSVLNQPKPSKADLERLYFAYAWRESWRRAVSAWRSTTQHVQSNGDLVDLDEDDPMIRAAMLLGRSAWSFSRH